MIDGFNLKKKRKKNILQMQIHPNYIISSFDHLC